MRPRRLLAPTLLLLAATGAPIVAADATPAAPAPAPAPAIAAAAPAIPASGVPVRQVVLYSSGVGYFEHSGPVDGAAAVELRFKAAQINDILKSLVLQDDAGHPIGTVEYPSLDPLEKTLKSFQVDITDTPSLAQLLNQLRGAAITVATAGEQADGTVLGVETRTRQINDHQTIEESVLNLLAGGSIRQFALPDLTRLTFHDAQLQAELERALQAVSQARDQDQKPVVIHLTGDGRHQVRIGYVVETPVWKTSYRLVLPPLTAAAPAPVPAAAAPAAAVPAGYLQGWAMVENQSDNDWNDVALTLVSGRPISFIEDLYQPLYVPRPTVEPELYASLRPQDYGGGMAVRDSDRPTAKAARAVNGPAADAAAPAAPQGLALMEAAVAPGGGGNDDKDAPRALDPTASVQSAAAAGRLGDLFEYHVGNVTLPRQRSAMLPIVSGAITAERVSIYNPAVLAGHPLRGALVTNSTGKYLLQGPVTVLETDAKGGFAYAGDAQLDNLPPGDHRLVSFAIDIPVKLDADADTDDRTVATGRIANGVLVLGMKELATRTYRADNGADEPRTLVIEHAFHPGWKLAGAEPFEKTDTVWRYRLAVAAHQSADLKVSEERDLDETVALMDSDADTIAAYVQTTAISQAVRDALANAVQLKRDAVAIQARIQTLTQQIATLTADEARLRENLRAVGQGTSNGQRLQGKLTDEDTKIEGMQNDLEAQRQALDAKRQALSDAVAKLNLP
jgi:hypothetical protein